MESKPATDTDGGKQMHATEPEQLITNLRNPQTEDYLRVESDGRLVGVYTLVGGELTYRSGPKELTGSKARKYLVADINTGGVSRQFVSIEAAGPFNQTGSASKERQVTK